LNAIEVQQKPADYRSIGKSLANIKVT